MLTTAPHLTEDQSAALQNRIARIGEETNAAMILCFGVRISHVFIRSSFLHASDEVRSAECDLVILTNEKEKRTRDKISETATRENDAALKFTVLVHGVEAVNAKLKEGHPFFSTLFQNDEVLYDNHTFLLTVPGLIPPLAVSNIVTYWTKRYECRQPLLSGSHTCTVRGVERPGDLHASPGCGAHLHRADQGVPGIQSVFT